MKVQEISFMKLGARFSQPSARKSGPTCKSWSSEIEVVLRRFVAASTSLASEDTCRTGGGCDAFSPPPLSEVAWPLLNLAAVAAEPLPLSS